MTAAMTAIMYTGVGRDPPTSTAASTSWGAKSRWVLAQL